MISSSLSIKILGCTFIVGMTIGIPVIAVNEHAKKRQEEIDKPTNITNFLTNLVSVDQNLDPVIKSGETFSDEAIKKWTPNNTEKTAIATNFSSITKHMPNEFFEKLKNKNLTTAAGVCHITTYKTTVRGREKQLYIPVLKSEIKSSIRDVRAKGSNSIEYHEGNFLTGSFGHDKYKEELQKIIDGTKQPALTPGGGQSATKQIAKDLLTIQTRYEETISRLVELGNIDTSLTNKDGLLWDYC